MKYKGLSDNVPSRYKILAYKNPLYHDALLLRQRFIECGLDATEPRAWSSLCLYLELTEYGVHFQTLTTAVKDLLTEYGPDTLFYQHWLSTRRLRNQQKLRVLHVARKLVLLQEWKVFPPRQRGLLAMFLKHVPKALRYLRKSPLSMGLRRELHTAEHILGIWYDDLSPEENGVFLRPTADPDDVSTEITATDENCDDRDDDSEDEDTDERSFDDNDA